MTVTLVVGVAAAIGLVTGLATPAVLRRLPEPLTTADAEAKIPYATLATPSFDVAVGALAALGVLLPGLLLPAGLAVGWVVLATLGVLLAAIDARTTWLPLPLTRVAWLATGAALLAVGVGAGWSAALRGLGGFLLAGGVFGAIWLISRGGFGFGDVRYAPLVGAATASASWTLLAWALVLGSLVGAAVGLVRLSHGRRGAFAYAPAILTGAYLSVVAGWLLG